MLDIAFQYSYEKKDWVQCTNTDFVEKNIEELPIVPMEEWTGYGDNDGLHVYCYNHDRFEDIITIYDNRVISADGCIFEGLFVD